MRYFNEVPVIRHARSRFDLSHSVKTSLNVGQLIPFDIQEVYAGDTFKMRTTAVSRLTSQFIRPVMDNLFLDIYYFYVPSRLLYDKFVNIFGENDESAWANTQDYEVPTISGTVSSGSVADYLGLPVGKLAAPVSVLPFRAFAKIYNEWFRDQNNVAPMNIQNGEVNEKLNGDPWAPDNYTGVPPTVAKFHDYFTSCLPAPQKGDPSSVPILNGSGFDVPLSGILPVVPYGSGARIDDTAFNATNQSYRVAALKGVGSSLDNNVNGLFGSTTPGSAVGSEFQFSQSFSPTFAGSAVFTNMFGNPAAPFSSVTSDELPSVLHGEVPAGIQVGNVTVNDLRFAFQYQKMLERDARSGSRFVEYLASHFNVQAGDYRLQRSEFLGGRRSPLSIQQVTQTTGSGDDSSPLAQVGAFSLSNMRTRFTKSFVEPGYVIGVCCIRQFHTYQQGIERFWRRSKRTDFFDPVFDHIGEQPVYATELYGLGETPGDRVFGYNEAWADLRYRPNRVTGQMRSGVENSLDFWHFADDYSNAPTLSQNFIQEVPTYVNRAITVNSSEQDQFIIDFFVQNIAYRPLPTFSIPSLVDHD